MAWSGNKSAFSDFEERLNKSHYDRLFSMGIHFRVPPPDVKIVRGKIQYSKSLTNSKIVFTNDSTIPTKKSAVLCNPGYKNIIEYRGQTTKKYDY